MKSVPWPSHRVLITAIVACVIAACVHRPLPEGLTECLHDRIVMHLIEPALRLSYLYPADKLCPDAACRVTWTRIVLNFLSRVIDPRILFDVDFSLSLATEHFNGVKVRTYLPHGNRTSKGAVFFIHGGGFVLGNTEIYEGLMRRMTKMLNIVVISVDYRLAPEAIYPGGLHDCEDALSYFIEHAVDYDVDPSKIVIMGDSAGGNLVASMVQRRRDRKVLPALAGQVLLYPLLQFHDLQTSSFRFYHKEMTGLAFIDPTSLAYYYMWYAGVDVVNHPELALSAVYNGHVDDAVANNVHSLLDFSDLRLANESALPSRVVTSKNQEAMDVIRERLLDPSFVPLVQKDLASLPKSLVVTCEFDILRDEGALYARRLKASGVPTQWKHYKYGFHAMLNFHNELYIAQESLRFIVDWTTQTIAEK